jgi:hypothetical protein
VVKPEGLPPGQSETVFVRAEPLEAPTKRMKLRALPLLALAVVLFAGCGGSDDTTMQTLSRLTTPSFGTGRPLHPVRAARERKEMLAPKSVPAPSRAPATQP